MTFKFYFYDKNSNALCGQGQLFKLHEEKTMVKKFKLSLKLYFWIIFIVDHKQLNAKILNYKTIRVKT